MTMAKLHVEDIPDDIYSALCNQAKLRGKSVAQEVISLLESHVPTARQLERRQLLLKKALRMSALRAAQAGPPSEEILRLDRSR